MTQVVKYTGGESQIELHRDPDYLGTTGVAAREGTFTHENIQNWLLEAAAAGVQPTDQAWFFFNHAEHHMEYLYFMVDQLESRPQTTHVQRYKAAKVHTVVAFLLLAAFVAGLFLGGIL